MLKVSHISGFVRSGLVASALLLPGLSLGDAQLDSLINSFATNDGYVQPFATLFGSVTNAGWYQSAWVGKGFGFYIGIPLNIAYPASQDKTYNATWVDDGCVAYHYDPQASGSNCNPVTNYQAPTIFGGKGPVLHRSIYDPNSHTIIDSLQIQTLDGLAKLSLLPFGMPQVGVSFWYTELKLRYLMLPQISKLTSFSMPAIGIQHDLRSVFTHLPFKMPVDVSVVGNMTWLSSSFTPGGSTLGTLNLSASSYFYGLLVGYTFGPLEVFLKSGWSGANLKTSGSLILNHNDADSANWVYVNPHINVDGRNGLSASLNVALHLGWDVVAGQNLGAENGEEVNVLAYRFNSR